MTDCKGADCDTKKQKNIHDRQNTMVSLSLLKITHKFLFMRGKGGVRKSSVSVNLALALADQGFRVGLMDVDIHGPDIPRMLGYKGVLDINQNKKLIPIRYSKNLKAVSIEALNAGKDDAIIWRGPMKISAIKQFFGHVEWGELDYLIIDSPPGTGDEPLTVAQTVPDAQAIIVTTPQEISLADVRKSINFCQTVKMRIFGLIENMSGFSCPHCDREISLFGAGGGEKTARLAEINFLGKIPFDPRVVACGDSGTSFQEMHPDSPVAKTFVKIAEKMSSKSQ